MKINKKLRSSLITFGIVILAFILCQVAIDGSIDGFSMSRLLKKQMVPVCVYIVLAVSLNLVVGISGELSLGHAGFMGVGAFAGIVVAALLQDLIPNEFLRLLIAMFGGGLIAGIAGAERECRSTRRRCWR